MMEGSGQITIGILAHVDAGKTTLAESILYQTGSIRRAGRVDHGDAFLDTFSLEKERGITIFSKQARFQLEEGTCGGFAAQTKEPGAHRARVLDITLLDTPGHVDFSAEMERVLQVLDYAILVISAPDGIQGHVRTLWGLLKRYRIPVFVFVNKMDQPGTDQKALLSLLRERLDENCICFDRSGEDQFQEDLAMCDEALLDQYMDGKLIGAEQIRDLIDARKVFPCYFGSALKMDRTNDLLDGLSRFMKVRHYPDEFGARVFKISRDQGQRLTWMKITGGTLKVRQRLGDEDKADQIRLYSGSSFQTADSACAGCVCAVTGLDHSFAGQALGMEAGEVTPVLEPVLTYALKLPDDLDVHTAFLKLQQLEEEIPELHLVWEEVNREIRMQLMGAVQMEIIIRMIRDRYGWTVSFDEGKIVYRETITNTVEGVGHYEPLRHYAEVHLLMQPGDPGSGLQFDSVCSTDDLDLNWQRLILTHLEEKRHIGVLTGSEITDMRITLAAGRAHLKHTEGGDFRQATWRAVRQGLCRADSILLEPVYEFRLEVPEAAAGRAISDIQSMYGTFEGPVLEGGHAVFTGKAPVECMRNYQSRVAAYSHGEGHLSCVLKGYEPCHNAREVIETIGYSAQADTANPADSVFCSHGAGMVVPWDQVEKYMHLESVRRRMTETEQPQQGETEHNDLHSSGGPGVTDEELMAIFEKTYGKIRKERSGWTLTRSYGQGAAAGRRNEPEGEKVLLVDGYNIIYAWKELAELAKTNMDAARMKLMDILSNYQGFRQIRVILVFDAWKVAGGVGEQFRYHNIFVVYTREAETADSYIERTVSLMADEGASSSKTAVRYDIQVATSDAAEQMIIWGKGARRLSAKDLKEEIDLTVTQIREIVNARPAGGRRYLLDGLDRSTLKGN